MTAAKTDVEVRAHLAKVTASRRELDDAAATELRRLRKIVSSIDSLRFEQVRPVSEGEIDADLALYGFDAKAAYPEYSHSDLRQAWIAGRDDALVRAFRCLKENG